MKYTQYGAMHNEVLLVFASDNTGVLAENMGLTIMSQFPHYSSAKNETIPFINTPEKVQLFIDTINQWHTQFAQVIVFSTFAQKEVRQLCSLSLCVPFFDFFDMTISNVASVLHQSIVESEGSRHLHKKDIRSSAIDYALAFDDGQKLSFDAADIVLLGLSRSGKTPTALWLALHYGLNAANYPITADDFDKNTLPANLLANMHKCVLLLPSAQRLSQIRQERYKNSTYASYSNCQSELQQLQNMQYIKNVPVVDVSNKSVEEIAAHALSLTNIHPKGRF